MKKLLVVLALILLTGCTQPTKMIRITEDMMDSRQVIPAAAIELRASDPWGE